MPGWEAIVGFGCLTHSGWALAVRNVSIWSVDGIMNRGLEKRRGSIIAHAISSF